MPSSTFFGFQHINENLMCSIQIDMSREDRELAEILEIAIVPVDMQLQVHEHFPIFNAMIKPFDPNSLVRKEVRVKPEMLARVLIGGNDSDKVADMLHDWFASLKLAGKKRIIPLVYNYPVIRETLIKWLGYHNFLSIFSEDHRDILSAAHICNDRHATRRMSVPFSKQSLRWIGKQLHVEYLDHGGSCLDDCKQIAEIYKKMMLIHM